MSKRKSIIFSILILPVFFSGLFAGISPCKDSQPAPVVLEFWSVFDNSDVYQPLISEFQAQYPYITINYYKKDATTYEKELIDALAAGRGPDIFSIHNTWLTKHKDKLSVAPDSMIDAQKYQNTFVDSASQDFVDSGKIYAFPFYIDTLALFYNRSLLNSAGVASPPKTWADFNSVVEKIAQKDARNNILRAGAALGTAKNINRSTDILTALMLQSGAKMVSDDKTRIVFDSESVAGSEGNFNPSERALLFYTSFANPVKKVYTWNRDQHYSIDAFIEGKAAMMINYSYQISVLRERAPHLDFGVASLPQISDTGLKVNFSNYWAQAVSKNSSNQTSAWQFLAWMSGQEVQKKYLTAARKPAVRRDLIDWQSGDPDLGVFAKQSLLAKSWSQPDNIAIEKIFADMVESVVDNKSTVGDALREASQKAELLMEKN